MSLVKPLTSFRIWLFILCAIGAQNVSAQAAARIMVVGDSISAGWENPSFRMPLVNALKAETCDVDMVGNQTLTTYRFDDPETYPGKHFPYFAPSLNQPVAAHWTPSQGDDTDHQSFPGIQTDEIANGVASVLPIASFVGAEQPDYILLQTGSSDLNKAIGDGMRSDLEINRWANETIAEIRLIVERSISAHQNPSSLKILIGNFIPSYTTHLSGEGQLVANHAAELFTRKISAFVETRQDSSVLLVDVASDYDNEQMSDDGLNPNVVGENHIAGAFLTVLRGSGLCGSSYPAVSSPSIGSPINGENLTINWLSNGLNVDRWRVYIGDTQSGDSSNYFDSGYLPSSSRSISASGLPADGSNVFITLEYQVDGITDITLTNIISLPPTRLTKGSISTPELFSPVAGETVEGGEATFRWTANSSVVTQWWLRIGSSAGASDYHSSNRIEDPTQLTEYVSDLPTDGKTIHATLYYKSLQGNWDRIQQTYTTGIANDSDSSGDTDIGPVLVSPTEGSILSGSSQTFTWDTKSTGVRQWWFRAGSFAGGSDFFDSGRITDDQQRSITVANLPTDGSTVHISLHYKTTSGSWNEARASFKASDGDGSNSGDTSDNSNSSDDNTDSSGTNDASAALVSPTAGSVFSGSNQTFTWGTDSNEIRQWWFRLGSSPGGLNYYDSGRITDANKRSVSVSNLPTDGSTVHASLHFKIQSGSWEELRYTYKAGTTTSSSSNDNSSSDSVSDTEAAVIIEARLVNPSAGTVLTGSSQSFTWDTDSSRISEWWFRAGSSSGASNYFDSGRITNANQRSITATNLPQDGSTVHIRLFFKTATNSWDDVQYTFKASSSGGSSTSIGDSGSGGSTASSSSPPALNLSTVKWLHSDVSGWAESATMNSVTVNSSNVCLNYDQANTWPSRYIHNADLVGNAWVFIWNDSDSSWYGATWEWLRPGQTCKLASAVNGEHIKLSPYSANSGWKPTSGETLYFMVSGLARSGDRNVLARTKPVKIIWP